jgi:hypothetical protein
MGYATRTVPLGCFRSILLPSVILRKWRDGLLPRHSRSLYSVMLLKNLYILSKSLYMLYRDLGCSLKTRHALQELRRTRLHHRFGKIKLYNAYVQIVMMETNELLRAYCTSLFINFHTTIRAFFPPNALQQNVLAIPFDQAEIAVMIRL